MLKIESSFVIITQTQINIPNIATLTQKIAKLT